MFDDDADPSPSSSAYLESPHEAKRKALMKKLEHKGMKDAASKPGTDLKQLRLALLKGQVDKREEQSKGQDDAKKVGSMATKTREQELALSTLTADTKPSAEQLVKQGVQDEKAQETLQRDEVQSEDA